ncbi:MAG TPA: hypothetical protein VK501_11135 [Baekduia sp.]|uniref:hypothetical protein n=1 Tax=Baekduia sp. TaxID=2600305 RepID=UPI002D0DC06B|nr:hypothetical protein [Baekduia sp.]HMJ34461.1 hypothetical protein [Baekduia sp.]
MVTDPAGKVSDVTDASLARLLGWDAANVLAQGWLYGRPEPLAIATSTSPTVHHASTSNLLQS